VIGETLSGRYEISRLLGQGGMGAVYEARHKGTGRRVAVKIIHAGLDVKPAMIARFELEARAAGGIESRHIAQVLDVGRDETRNVPYLVMEFLVGEDLQQLIRRLGPLRPELAARIVAQAALGLEKAHAGGIVHRDIKPANLFLTHQEDEHVLVKLLDFGVAKMKLDDSQGGVESNGLTKTGSLLGSPLYMSPEQARGNREIDQRSDVWSLGVVIYQSLTGRTPFHHIEAMGELIISICSTPAADLREYAPWVPEPLAMLVKKSLTIAPDLRFQSARELYDALRTLLPNGTGVDISMLTAMTDEERASAPVPLTGGGGTSLASSGPGFTSGAPVLTGPTAPLTPPAAANSDVSVATVAVTTPGATSQGGSSPAPAAQSVPPRKSGVAIAAIAAIGLSIGGAAAFLIHKGPTEPTPRPPNPALATTAEVTATATAVAAPSAAVSAAPTVSVAPTSTPSAVAPLEESSKVATTTPPKGGGKLPTSAPTAKAVVTSAPTVATPAATVSGRIIRTDLPN
jgi:serine/threonine-protein kinase